MKLLNKKPNVLQVAVRLLLIIAALFGAYSFVDRVGIAKFKLWHSICFYVLLAFAALVLLQLIVWGLSWVRNERVSELGLHIVRFAVILAAVAMSVFVMLSVDYTKQYRSTLSNELEQQALAVRVYVQNAIGSEVSADPAYLEGLGQKMQAALDDNASNADRHVVLYLRDPAGFGAESGFLTFSSSENDPPCADEKILWDVIRSNKLAFDEYTAADAVPVSGSDVVTAIASAQAASYYSAFTPVCTSDGKPAGVLELCERRPAKMSVFSFASLELFLSVAAFICMFSFLFYGFMQLVDIALRPRKFDKSRKVLSCGREAVRPVLFFVTLIAALPVMMFFYSEEIRRLVSMGGFGERIGSVLMLLVYLLGIGVGMIVMRGQRAKLSELPSDIAIGVSALCNIGMMLLLDWKKLEGNTVLRNWVLVALLVLVSGICLGISYRTISKFQGQSDALFGVDKYAYLCSCLGAIAGITLGAVLMDISGDMAVRIFMIILSVVTCVISTLLLEDLESTVDTSKSYVDQLAQYDGAILTICAVGLACCFDWVYITSYFYRNGYSIAALAFCIAAPIIAFCFGNRLHLRSRNAMRTALVISAALSAAAFLPMIISPSEIMAFASCMILCLAVIFASAGLYSSMKHKEERTICFGKVRPLLFVGILAFALIVNLSTSRIFLLSGAVLALAAGIAALVTKFPNRPETPVNARKAAEKPVFAAAGMLAAGKDAVKKLGFGKKAEEKKEKPEKIEKKEKPQKEPRPKPEKTPKPEKAPKPEKKESALIEHKQEKDTEPSAEKEPVPAPEPIYEPEPIIVAEASEPKKDDSASMPFDLLTIMSNAPDYEEPAASPFDTPRPPSGRMAAGGLSLEDLSASDDENI